MKTVSQMIQELSGLGITQTELAQRTGASQSTISRIARGLQAPGYELGRAIERELEEAADQKRLSPRVRGKSTVRRGSGSRKSRSVPQE